MAINSPRALNTFLMISGAFFALGIAPVHAQKHPLEPRFGTLTRGAAHPMLAALEQIGLQPDDMRFNPIYFKAQGSDLFLLRTFPLYMDQPLEIPYLLSHVRLGAIEEPASIHETMQGMLTKVDSRVRRGLLDTNPLAPLESLLEQSAHPLADAIAGIHQWTGDTLNSRQKEDLKKQAGDIPRDIQKFAGLVLHAVASAAEWRERAFRRVRGLLTPAFQKRLVASLLHEDESDMPEEIEWVVENTDFLSLYAGAADLALAVDRAHKSLAKRTTTETLSLDWETPLGRVVIRAGGHQQNSRADASSMLLSIDMGGDDLYEATEPIEQNLSNVASIILDMAGDDTYRIRSPEGSRSNQDAEFDGKEPLRSLPVGHFGAGLFGYGILIDSKGNDTYKTGAMSLGSGVFGFGALLDMTGSDSYESVFHSQGAGSFGLGLLADLGGEDRYEAYSMAQGYGFTKGCGMLLDMGDGNDWYDLKNDRILLPAAQAPETHNCSAGQGFGMGLRGDLSDGHSWAGGYGLLIDEGGDDTYDAAVMAQGSGFWYGLGFLLDRDGNDAYSGYWYCQGSGAHFAVGGLVDWAGDDSYKCGAQVAMGGAHDWSVAWMVDAAGNDRYEAGDLSLGAGNMNGIGLFLDVQGEDFYSVSPNPNRSAGAARITTWGSLREAQMNAGVFLDCGGRDTYEGLRGANDSTWQSPRDHPELSLPSENGIGVDCETNGISPVRIAPYTEKPPEEEKP